MSLIQFCKDGDLEGVKAALQSGADVNTKDGCGWTGLKHAVARNYCECDNSMVALLLSTPNIDVNLKDNNGRTGLMRALTNDYNSVVALLLNTPNIDVNQKDNKGKCALHFATEDRNNETSKLLLSHPSMTTLTINQKEKRYGYTPVMWAVEMNRLKHLEVLVADPRVDLDITDKEGRSLEEVAWDPKTRKVLAEAKQRREEKIRLNRLIRKQQRQVSKVLLDGLYDPDSPISKLLGVRMEVVGEIIWQKLVENWQIYPEQDEQDEDVQ